MNSEFQLELDKMECSKTQKLSQFLQLDFASGQFWSVSLHYVSSFDADFSN